MEKEVKEGNGEQLFNMVRKVNFTKPIEDENIKHEVSELINDLDKRTNEAEAFKFLIELSILNEQGVFYHLEQAHILLNYFKVFKFSIPDFVINCQKELNARTEFISKFYKEKQYLLTDEEKGNIIKEFNEETKKNSFDKKSNADFLRQTLNKLVIEIQNKEREVKDYYGLSISDYYEDFLKNEKSVNLNDYFFYSQCHIGSINNFTELVLILIRYFNLKKEFYVLKEINTKGSLRVIESPSLNDFFTEKSNSKLVNKIQEYFKNLKNKEMAILIYLLHKKYSLIYLDNNQRNNKSRIHFVRALTGKKIKTITGINNFFEPITAETTVNEKDEVFLKIDNQLKEMVSTG